MGEFRAFVGGLAWATDDRALEQAFSRFGQVVESKVSPRNTAFLINSRGSRIFAYNLPAGALSGVPQAYVFCLFLCGHYGGHLELHIIEELLPRYWFFTFLFFFSCSCLFGPTKLGCD
jgi:hypothetical protein